MMKQFTIGIAALFITTAAAHARCPIVGQESTDFKLKEGFTPDPSKKDVSAGREIDLSKCSEVRNAKGWVTLRPNFIVTYETRSGGNSAAPLIFLTDSKADTVLLVNDPKGGWHFNDDGGKGLNAKITFKQAPPGRYDVWVGGYTKGDLTPSKLLITELQ